MYKPIKCCWLILSFGIFPGRTVQTKSQDFHVSKVNTIFEFSLTIFVFWFGLSFFRLGLSSESNSASTDVISNGDCRSKKIGFLHPRLVMPSYWPKIFDRQPPLKMTSVDAEFDSELNPSVFRPNPSFKTNMERIYRTNISKNSYILAFPPSFCPTTPSKNSTVRCRIKFCTQPKSKETQPKSKNQYGEQKLEYGANFSYVEDDYIWLARDPDDHHLIDRLFDDFVLYDLWWTPLRSMEMIVQDE